MSVVVATCARLGRHVEWTGRKLIGVQRQRDGGATHYELGAKRDDGLAEWWVRMDPGGTGRLNRRLSEVAGAAARELDAPGGERHKGTKETPP